MSWQHVPVTKRELDFLCAAREWSEAKLAEEQAEFDLGMARQHLEETKHRRYRAEAALENARHALLADFESDALPQAGPYPAEAAA